MHADSSELAQNISAVERETGLSKDVLRMWERRYGFPKPARDDNGERQYTPAETSKLRAIKRLMDVGARPGKIIRLSLAELNALADARAPLRRDVRAAASDQDIVAMLLMHDISVLQHALAQWLMRDGLQRFVVETLAPLNRTVGEAWVRGELHVFEEHLFTEQVQASLRTAINTFPRRSSHPRVLLTTLPGEQHGLGLLMIEALLVAEGAHCVSLGPQTPLDEIRLAAVAHGVDVVALSFSSAFPVRQAADGLARLRRHLPSSIALWAGGDMTRRVRKTLPGVLLLADFGGSVTALRSWRANNVSVPTP
ncbi:MAG TPA: MerR family transcriptional regulator [Casimicrobiaceae bacterium]|nr:MerR family transcriptional regulator [Casimicrobiaceae bacterium]